MSDLERLAARRDVPVLTVAVPLALAAWIVVRRHRIRSARVVVAGWAAIVH